MQRRWLFALSGISLALTTSLLVLVGCGGGGGPIAQPPSNPGPTISQAFLDLLPDVQKNATYVGTDKCLSCHGGQNAQAPHIDVAGWQQTQHARVGVGCEQCHGPGSAHAAAPSDANILTMPRVSRSLVCGQCHGPIFSDYGSSAHAEAVEDVVEESIASPAALGKQCMRCHSAPFRADLIENTIDNAKAPAFQRADEIEANIQALSNDEVVALAHETHETAACVSCHDPMRVTGNLDENGRELQLLRRVSLDPDADRALINTYIGPGAPTKLHTVLPHICGSCHNGRGADPSDAALQRGTARPSFHEGPQMNMLVGMTGVETVTGAGGAPQPLPPTVRNTAHARAPGQCSHCHMPAGKHTMIVNLEKSCSPCHTAEDAQARMAVQGLIQNRLVALRSRMSNWASANLGNPDFWDYTALLQEEGKTPPTAAQEAAVPIEIKRARHNYYFVLRDGSFGVHNIAYTRYLLDVADQNLDALGVSRAAKLSLRRDQVLAILRNDARRSRMASGRNL